MAARKGTAGDLETLRRYRVRRERDLGIAGDLERAVGGLRRARAAAGGLDGAWEELVPDVLRGCAAVDRLSPNGVLTVRATSAAAAYEAEQWLRGAGLDALRARCVKPVRTFKIVVK